MCAVLGAYNINNCAWTAGIYHWKQFLHTCVIFYFYIGAHWNSAIHQVVSQSGDSELNPYWDYPEIINKIFIIQQAFSLET